MCKKSKKLIGMLYRNFSSSHMLVKHATHGIYMYPHLRNDIQALADVCLEAKSLSSDYGLSNRRETLKLCLLLNIRMRATKGGSSDSST